MLATNGVIKSRLVMRGSNNLPDDHCVFRVFPETSQAGRPVCGPWIVREFQNVRGRCGPEQTAEPIIAEHEIASVGPLCTALSTWATDNFLRLADADSPGQLFAKLYFQPVFAHKSGSKREVI